MPNTLLLLKDSKDIIEAFDFDPRSTKRERDENRFLEILRGNEGSSEDSGHGSPPPPGEEGGNPGAPAAAASGTHKVSGPLDMRRQGNYSGGSLCGLQNANSAGWRWWSATNFC